ncbi:MAG TPA: peptidyl-prolyl cis-trans isomerase [Terriglobales bacterium]|nr:peptidyl-prolyl cis-trans isomerase [Terriglobales bacterium]
MDRATTLLALGAVAGIAFATAGLVTGSTSSAELPADLVARVNDQGIRRIDYERMVNAVAGDKRSAIADADRQHVLNRLIEEELLVQRALELGLAYHDGRVRKDLTAAILDSIAAEARDAQPSEEELRRFYQEHKEFLTAGEQLHVRQVWFRINNLSESTAAYARAKDAADRLRRGAAIEQVRAEIGDAEIAPLPDALLPATKLSDYLGPTALRSVIDLPVGQITEPVRSSTGYHVLQLVERAPAPAPPFEQIRDQVLEAYRRRAADQALRAYLDDLRSRASIEIVEGVP